MNCLYAGFSRVDVTPMLGIVWLATMCPERRMAY